MRWLWALALIFATTTAQAQQAILVADAMTIEGRDRLVATGNVEILYETTRVKATRVTYDQTTDTLQIDGPITLIDGDTLIVIADQAQLSDDLRNGVLSGARIVLAEQLQLAALEVNRVDGRYTQLYKVSASSCHVCGPDDQPLWQIRAKRVVHDQLERQLYFDNVQLRVLDVPVFWLPRMRLPDPTLDRARGFMVPRLRTTSQLGTGLKIPYFIPIGDDKDLTLTPYLSSKTTTLEFRYRQAFVKGDINFVGAVTNDDLLNDNRGYIFGQGQFDLARGYTLTFDLEVTSDDAYLLDYGYSSKDRLDSAISIARTRSDDTFDATLTYYKTLRAGEQTDALPPLVGDVRYNTRLRPARFGGTLDLGAAIHGHNRFDDTDATLTDANGRDVARLSAEAIYQRDWLLNGGVLLGLDLGLRVDAYNVGQDPNFQGTQVRSTPAAALTLRYPLHKWGRTGISHLIEPVVHLAWSDTDGDDVFNEDSTRVSFDEGNLYALNRFAGVDAQEVGARATLGLGYTRIDPNGWTLSAAVGRSYRSDDHNQFTVSSGLDGKRSDWLTTLQIKNRNGLSLTNRAIFDDDLSLTRNDLRIDWRNELWTLASTYYWSIDDPALAPAQTEFSELTLDAGYKFNRYWTGLADLRYDFNADEAASAGLGLRYENECILVNMGLSRRFTETTTLNPTTDFDLSVSLKGFSTGGARGTVDTAHRCN
ncbi:LPS-assembly protein LptD [Nereida sp. MMG025]|uniref:LPS-assembly protein LptD n=1 Tax=Nereida sp. MMG025 TaxID=2909981 RepID=UPI001F0170A5|nr:LPS assembly protein LptD [Nereida sp. MMG025]MCF6443444.1 LPS assembly protein LptD [Nereida sp. MMG025]